jgi:hypothetical protein
MKAKLSGIGLAALKGSVELLLLLPVLLITGVYLFPVEVSLWLWLFTLLFCYAAGYSVNVYVPLGKRFQLLFIVILLGAAAAIIVSGLSYAFWIILPFTCLSIYRGARMVTWPWSFMFPISFYAVGLLIYFISSIFLQFVPSFEPFLSMLTWFGLLALAVTLLMTNQATMKQETLSGDKEPVIASGVMRQNRVLVILVLIFIVLVVLFRKLQAALIGLKDQIIAWLLALFNQPAEPPAPKGAPAPPPNMGLGEAAPPAAWLQWLEKIMMVVVGIALVIGVLLLLYIAARKLPPLFKRLFRWLMVLLNQRGQRQKAVGYEDDVESLMDWKRFNNSLTNRFKKWVAGQFEQKPQWQSMDNRERVRYLYRQWIRKHAKDGYQLQKHLTPEETNKDIQSWSKEREPTPSGAMIGMYEQARYGHKPMNEKDIEALKKIIETKSGN